jgi:hypothetical protein
LNIFSKISKKKKRSLILLSKKISSKNMIKAMISNMKRLKKMIVARCKKRRR